ncbi:MAG: molybdopterin dinucleotide binding domain-containing protein, partial [Eggerthellaceae bacterium]
TAARRGIADGDEVEVSNELHTGRCRVKVTQRMNPTAIFLPPAYGCTSEEQHTAYGVGLRSTDYTAYQLEAGYGSTMAHEVLVTVKKVGA